MSKLYEISSELSLLHAEIEREGGILDDILEKKLDELAIAFEDKCEGIVRLVRNTEGDEIALVNEISRLKERLNSKVRLRERLENYLKTSMEVAGKEEVDLGIHSIALVLNPPKAEEIDASKTPSTFVTFKTEIVINKKAILDSLKQGVEVEGWKLSQGRRLRIK